MGEENSKMETTASSRLWSDEANPVLGYSASDKGFGTSASREDLLTQMENDKKATLIRVWSEGKRTRANNKAEKKMSSILSWENTKKAELDAEIKRIEEKLEKKKAEHAEKMKNKAARIQREAELKRAIVEAEHGEQLIKTEEASARYFSTGQTPKKGIIGFGCFGS